MSATTAPMIQLSKFTAEWQLLEVLTSLAVDGLTDSFFSSLNYGDAASMADFLHANDKSDVAGKFMAQWASNDEDWAERNEDGDVDAWIALIPEGERELWAGGITGYMEEG